MTAGSYTTQMADAKAKLSTIQLKLDEIEEMKAIEPNLRRDAAALKAKIEQLCAAEEAEKSEKAFFAAGEVEEEEQPAPSPAAPAPVKQPPAAPRDPEGERKAQMRALNKKLQQIDRLKLKGLDTLDADAKAKVASEGKLRKQLAAVERGEALEESEAEAEAEAEASPPTKVEAPQESDGEGKDDHQSTNGEKVILPTDPAEVEKRLRTLKKKLQQIAKLKEKEGPLDEEALQKMISESRILQEVAALEEGKDEIIFVEQARPTPEEEKTELEKRLKTLKKKLTEIEKLKKMDNFDADAKAKVASESAFQKEVNLLQAKIGEINKKERERVADRLGWTAEVQEIKAEQKEAKKMSAKSNAKKK